MSTVVLIVNECECESEDRRSTAEARIVRSALETRQDWRGARLPLQITRSRGAMESFSRCRRDGLLYGGNRASTMHCTATRAFTTTTAAAKNSNEAAAAAAAATSAPPQDRWPDCGRGTFVDSPPTPSKITGPLCECALLAYTALSARSCPYFACNVHTLQTTRRLSTKFLIERFVQPVLSAR